MTPSRSPAAGATRPITLKAEALARRLDLKIGTMQGYPSETLSKAIETLVAKGRVEFGYRSSCGSTHLTLKIFREWQKVLNELKRRDGIAVTEESVKHGNAYATINGGFWQSTIYRLVEVPT